MTLVRRIRNRLARIIAAGDPPDKNLKTFQSLLRTHGFVEQLHKKDRLKLLEKAKWAQELNLPGYNLSFIVRSKKEYSRIRNFKEHWTIDWINSLPARAVLWDVGANIGIMSAAAALRDDIDKVVAIEPFFKNYAALVENIMINDLSHKTVVVCGGLGDRTAFIPLRLQNLVESGALHSFGEITDLGAHSNVPVGEQSCLCFRVDDLVMYEGIPFPTHFKIDIDGFELALLNGAAKTLADPRVVGIQIETMDQADNSPQRQAVISLLEGHGFRLEDKISHKSEATEVFDLQFVR